MSKNDPGAPQLSLERQFKEMSERASLEMVLVGDDHGFCWSSAGNHFDTGILAALPSVLDDAVASGRLRLRYFSEGKAGFDVDGTDVRALLREAGLAGENAPSAAAGGFPAWLLSVAQADSTGCVEFTLSSDYGRVIIRPLSVPDCNLFLVGIAPNRSREKGAQAQEVGAVISDLAGVLKILESVAAPVSGDSSKAEQVQSVLTGLKEANAAILAVALHMDDGLVVASATDSGVEADTLAAISAGIFHSCRLVGSEVSGGAPEQIYFAAEKGTLIAMAVRDDLILTALISPESQIGIAETLIRHASRQLAGVVSQRTQTKAQEV